MRTIEYLIFDFDGIFYRFTDAFVRECNEAAARAAIRLGATMPLDEAMAIADRSYRTHGASLCDFQNMLNFSIEEAHHAYHDELEGRHVADALLTRAMLENCNVPIAILSHSSRPWLMMMLQKFGLRDVIPDAHIFGLEDVDYHLKLHNQQGYRKVLTALDADPARTMMVEDTAPNLVAAKALGMMTSYIVYDRPFRHADHPHVDYVFADTPAFCAAFAARDPVGNPEALPQSNPLAESANS